MMAKLHTVRIGEETFAARSGQVVLDAALLGGVDMPHDCRAGRCGACVARVKQGITLGGEARQLGAIHTCQARVFSDLALEVEALPPVVRVKGRVAAVAELAGDIVELVVALEQRFDMYPGQFCKLTFKGYPARPFSPTASLASLDDDGLLRFHIKRLRNGQVTQLIGPTIKERHTVVVEGPFGHAFLRPGLSQRLVLVGSGTGFAPVWMLAAAALRENPQRSIVMIAASRKIAGFYMAPALELVSGRPNVQIVATIEELVRDHRLVSAGSAVDHLPELQASDIVYACGAPKLVDYVCDVATAAGAQFYADAFDVAPAPPAQGWLDRARGWLKTG